MRKFILIFFLAVFHTTIVLAAGNTSISRAIPVKNDAETQTTEQKENTNLNRAGRRINVINNGEDKTVAVRGANRTNVKSSENVSKIKTNTGVISRSLNHQKSVSARPTAEDGANTFGRNARVNAASINNTAAVRRAGLTLRASTAEVGGRAMIIGTNKQTGSNIDEQVRNVQSRASLLLGKTQKSTPVTSESLAKAKDILEKTADLNNTCQKQYNECMDQFCAVVDANQKRCSCSANLSKYVKVQEAVENANTELNEVAQRIRYVGLSADEIRAIMSATEAEDAMTKNKDTTENRSLLDKIADMIKDPSSAASSAEDSGGILDLDMDFSSSQDTIFGLDLSIGGSSSDISKKRGQDLYNEATKRCKSVLTNCKDAGGTESQITGNYDLAIDKDCIAYEQGLDKLNKTLVSNVRSANLMLQKARLAVLQNKNQYDVRGCVGALENCMLDDMVCGENYFKCIDPTKKYINENGEVVLGGKLPAILEYMSGYDNSQIDSNFIRNAVSAGTSCDRNDGSCVVSYLMSKIGTGQTVKNGGLCRAVLDRCQDYTYVTNNSSSTYNPYNDVVVNYVQRAMVNIKAAQSQIISDYAASCLANMSECYNQQVNQINTLTTSANIQNVQKVMTGACSSVALTCGYSVFAYGNELAECTNTTTQEDKDMCVIEKISEVFYQSLLCPENSTFKTSGNPTAADANRKKNGWVNTGCQCDSGYTVWNGACLLTCSTNEYRNTLGVCEEREGSCTLKGGSNDIEYSYCE